MTESAVPVSVTFTESDAGCIFFQVTAGEQSVELSASHCLDPFPAMMDWLAKVSAGAAFTHWGVDQEGWATSFLVTRSHGLRSRFIACGFPFDSFVTPCVPTLPARASRYDRTDIDVLVDHMQLAAAFFEAFTSFVEGPLYRPAEWETFTVRRSLSWPLPLVSAEELCILPARDLATLVYSVHYPREEFRHPGTVRFADLHSYLAWARAEYKVGVEQDGSLSTSLRDGPDIPADFDAWSLEDRQRFVAALLDAQANPWDGDDAAALLRGDAAQAVRAAHARAEKMKKAPFHPTAETIPDTAGAYLLLIVLEAPLDIAISRDLQGMLAPGRYLYCGSAKGPGGLKARITRHMLADKKVRWHVDRLTTAGRVAGAWIFEGGNECELSATLAGLPIPIYGFGSSDCRVCPSHLFAWPEGVTLPFGGATE